MNFGSFAVVIEKGVVLEMATRLDSGFLSGRARCILDHGLILLNLAEGKLTRREEITQRNPWWGRLRRRRGLLLGLLSFLFLRSVRDKRLRCQREGGSTGRIVIIAIIVSAISQASIAIAGQVGSSWFSTGGIGLG